VSSPARVAELDGLRGVAILSVMLFHYAQETGPLHSFARVFLMGWIGVDLFFVLSGYLITGILLDSAGRPSYYRNFIIRRALRIFPLYYACLGLCGILAYYPGPFQWRDFFRSTGWYLAYIGNVKVFLENAWPRMAMLTPLWSLQVEEQFYFTFPLLVWALKRKTLARVLAAAVVLALAIRIVMTFAMPRNTAGTYALSPCRMDALAMGGLIAIVRREWPERLKNPWIGRGALLCAAVLVAIGVKDNTPWSNPMRTFGFTALDLAFAGLIATLIGRRPRDLLAVFRFRPLVWIGTISYGLYLLHIPAPRIAHLLLDPLVRIPARGSADFFLSFAAAIAAAWLSWRFFESRILKWKDRFT
jgi:peptidoglycan/LPS O-acetylase OafA/YrhL